MGPESIREIIDALSLEEEETANLPVALSAEEIEAFLFTYPRYVPLYHFHNSPYGPTTSVYRCKPLGPELDAYAQPLPILCGLSEVVSYVQKRRSEKGEPAFAFFCDGLDLGEDGFEKYELGDQINRLPSRQTGYLPYLSPFGAALVNPLVEEGGKRCAVTVFNEYWLPRETVKAVKKNVDDEMKRIANLLFEPGMPDVIKVFLAYNYMGYIADYFRPETPMGHDEYPLWVHSPDACLIRRVGVCDSFAKDLALLLDHAEVDCRLIDGQATNGEQHAWNIIRVNDVFYHADLTWDDEPLHSTHAFFLRSDAFMALTRSWDKDAYPACPAENDFAAEIERYLNDHRDRLLAKGVPEPVLRYDYRDLRNPMFRPFWRNSHGD